MPKINIFSDGTENLGKVSKTSRGGGGVYEIWGGCTSFSSILGGGGLHHFQQFWGGSVPWSANLGGGMNKFHFNLGGEQCFEKKLCAQRAYCLITLRLY